MSCAGDRRPGEYEVSIVAPDGNRLWFRSQISPYLDGNSDSGALIVAVDVTELKMAQKAVSELRQLLPVCAWCGDIQNDDGGWETVAQYLGERMHTSVTHGMCPNFQQEQTLALDRPKGWDSRY